MQPHPHLPKVDQRILLTQKNKPGSSIQFNSEIADLNCAPLIGVNTPAAKEFTAGVGDEVKIYYNKDNQGVFTFQAVIVQKDDYTLRLALLGGIHKSQRRDHFRLEMVYPLKLRQVFQEDYSNGFIKDISGGGLRLTSSLPLQREDLVELCFEIKRQVYQAKAKVRQVFSRPVNQWEAGVQFIELSESLRNQLIAALFEEQRLRIKKGKMP